MCERQQSQNASRHRGFVFSEKNSTIDRYCRSACHWRAFGPAFSVRQLLPPELQRCRRRLRLFRRSRRCARRCGVRPTMLFAAPRVLRAALSLESWRPSKFIHSSFRERKQHTHTLQASRVWSLLLAQNTIFIPETYPQQQARERRLCTILHTTRRAVALRTPRHHVTVAPGAEGGVDDDAYGPCSRPKRASEKSKTTSTALQLRSQQLANGK